MVEKKSKKIVILIWNMGLGGVQKRVRDIVIDLSKNYDCQVFLLIKDRRPDYFIKEIKSLANVHINYGPDLKERQIPLTGFWWVIKEFVRIKPDLCLTFLAKLSFEAVLLKYLLFWLKLKVILNEGILTTKYLSLNFQKKYRLWKWLVSITYSKADMVIVPSKACKKDLMENFNVSEEKINVINNWTLFPKAKTKGNNILI